ncbi:MAG: shikimate kinase [Pseudomonadota bacterium]
MVDYAVKPGRLKQTIVLIGLMGAGKSSVGLRLAQRLGVGFHDSDAEIEAAAGMRIAEIFERFGEPHFRDGERRVISRLLERPPMVLATGGGAFLNEETRALIAKGAVSVWLKAELPVLVARTSGRTHRPLLNQGNPEEVLAALIEARYPVYALADIAVESLMEQTHDDMAARIEAAIVEHSRVTGREILSQG